MTTRPRYRGGLPSSCLGAIAAALALASAIASASPQPSQLPRVQSGLWQFQRTVAGAHLSFRACENPIAKMNHKDAELRSIGCKFAGPDKSGDTYTFHWSCPMLRPKKSLSAVGTTVVTFHGDSAYTVDTTSNADGVASRDHLDARRIGKCAK